MALRIDSPKADFDATVTTQQQKIDTESRAKIEVRAGRLQVEQRIQYRVSYERLSEATLVLPKELRRASVQFTVDRPDLEAKIDPSWTTGEPSGSDIARIPLSPQPRIGTFELYAHYSVHLPESPSQAVEVPIPLVRSRDSAFKTLRVELHAPDDSEFEVVDDSWIPSLAIDKGSTYAWTAKGEQSVLPLRLVRVTALASPGVKIGRALVRSTLDPTGTALTTAQYRIQGPVSRIALTLPAGSTEPKFWLDRLPLKPERIREARPNSGEYLLDIGALSPEPEPVLTVQFGDPNAQSCDLIGSHTLGAPAFPDNTSVESTVWEVTLPFEQYLYSAPRGFTPEFRWQRDGAVWDRRPTPKAADLSRWLVGAARATADDGNTYAFSRFGPAQTIVVGSMAGSFVVFVGAGLALLAAFVLLRLRAARSLLTLFLFTFAVAVCCLWYAEAVRLLLQPALIGFLLACVAAVIDARMQKRRGRLLLEPPGAAEFVTTATSPSSIERHLVPAADPEAPTINRLSAQRRLSRLAGALRLGEREPPMTGDGHDGKRRVLHSARQLVANLTHGRAIVLASALALSLMARDSTHGDSTPASDTPPKPRLLFVDADHPSTWPQALEPIPAGELRQLLAADKDSGREPTGVQIEQALYRATFRDGGAHPRPRRNHGRAGSSSDACAARAFRHRRGASDRFFATPLGRRCGQKNCVTRRRCGPLRRGP